MILLCQIIFFDSFRLSNTSLCKGSNYIVYAANAYIKTQNLSLEDIEFLTLIHRLPSNKQYEFKGELKGYLKALNELYS